MRNVCIIGNSLIKTGKYAEYFVSDQDRNICTLEISRQPLKTLFIKTRCNKKQGSAFHGYTWCFDMRDRVLKSLHSDNRPDT